MKQTILLSILLIAAAFLAPLLASGQEPLLNAFRDTEESGAPIGLFASPLPNPSPASSPAASISPPPTESLSPTVPPKPENYQKDAVTMLTLLYEGQAVTLSLRELLTGILTSEMPFAYPDEALKAQAVAARTYALYCLENEGRHANADLCADPGCCLAYAPLEQLAQAWGEEGYASRVEALVDATDGQVLCYEGELCQATFFAVSSGRTESAEAVWGGALPYLVSVDSAWDETSEAYAAELCFDETEAKELLLRAWPSMALDGPAETWFGTPQRSEAGGVLYMEVGGLTVSGTDLRTVFGLASHNFTVSMKGTDLCFATRGHGHGVGLSQFGAGEMARAGADYAEILVHYYSGAELAYRLSNTL